MRFKAELPREVHGTLQGVVQQFEKIGSAGAPKQKSRAVVMLSPQGLSMVRVLLDFGECRGRVSCSRRDWQALVAAADDVLAFAELSTELFVEFRVQSQAEDCILLNLTLSHLSPLVRRPSGPCHVRSGRRFR